jgi:hypothetical protein
MLKYNAKRSNKHAKTTFKRTVTNMHRKKRKTFYTSKEGILWGHNADTSQKMKKPFGKIITTKK